MNNKTTTSCAATAAFCPKKMTLRCFLSLFVGLAVFSLFAYGIVTMTREQDTSLTTPRNIAATEFPQSSQQLREASAQLMRDPGFAESLSEIAPASGETEK